ncbi:hypothetical protein EDB86DRAFT_3247076 [Lactarius hatsudake]|nr:hypothetical protein EDB86DRAFT_3247076 [Lactarius hatsudake]
MFLSPALTQAPVSLAAAEPLIRVRSSLTIYLGGINQKGRRVHRIGSIALDRSEGNLVKRKDPGPKVREFENYLLKARVSFVSERQEALLETPGRHEGGMRVYWSDRRVARSINVSPHAPHYIMHIRHRGISGEWRSMNRCCQKKRPLLASIPRGVKAVEGGRNATELEGPGGPAPIKGERMWTPKKEGDMLGTEGDLVTIQRRYTEAFISPCRPDFGKGRHNEKLSHVLSPPFTGAGRGGAGPSGWDTA